MLPLGFQFSTTRILNVFSEKLYYVVIGKYFDTLTLGLFQRADVIRRSSSKNSHRCLIGFSFLYIRKLGIIRKAYFNTTKMYFPFIAPFSRQCAFS